MNRLNTNDIWTLVAVIALTGIAAFLAAAETSLTRMSRARAMHLREEQRRGAAQHWPRSHVEACFLRFPTRCR